MVIYTKPESDLPMRQKLLSCLTMLITLSAIPSSALVGQSAVPTLTYPFGARSYAMGEVGTALVDDESALYYNPAGLSVRNEQFKGGSASFFYEPILPAFKIPDLWHTSISAHFQDPSIPWCSPGFFWNYINMGKNVLYDKQGLEQAGANSWESVWALGCGFDLRELGITNHHLGVSLKYINSAIAPELESNGGGVGKTFAIDIGYLWTINNNLRFGATFMNMGPSIYYITPDHRDPIPFTMNLAIAYKNEFVFNNQQFMSVAGEFRLDKEIVNTDGNDPDPFYKAIWTDFLHRQHSTFHDQFIEFGEHLGGEATYCNTGSLRAGFLINPINNLFELHWGLGLRLFNHFTIDFGYITAPEGFMRSFSRLYDAEQTGSTGARNGTWHISFSATRLIYWDPGDLAWYQKK
jgi:hypothetical protein